MNIVAHYLLNYEDVTFDAHMMILLKRPHKECFYLHSLLFFVLHQFYSQSTTFDHEFTGHPNLWTHRSYDMRTNTPSDVRLQFVWSGCHIHTESVLLEFFLWVYICLFFIEFYSVFSQVYIHCDTNDYWIIKCWMERRIVALSLKTLNFTSFGFIALICIIS